jgi:hypothetical protein
MIKYRLNHMAMILVMLTVSTTSFAGSKGKRQNSASHHRNNSLHHGKHYLLHNDHYLHDRHDTRSPKWHPTIHEHRHVHD